jgi:hypothetical protein
VNWNTTILRRLRDAGWFIVGVATAIGSLVAYVHGRRRSMLAEVTCQKCGKCFTCHMGEIKPAIRFHEEFDCA